MLRLNRRPLFLSVGLHAHRLARDEARHVLKVQDDYRRGGIRPVPMVGTLCVELGYLSQSDVSATLVQQDAMVREGVRLKGTLTDDVGVPVRIKTGVVFFAATFAVIGVVGYRSGWATDEIAAYSGIAASVIGAMQLVLPQQLMVWRLQWNRVVRRLMAAMFLAGLAAIPWTANELLAGVATIAVMVGGSFSLLLAAWRGVELRSHEVRHRISAALDAMASGVRAAVDQSDVTLAEARLSLMSKTLQYLGSNPYARVAARLSLRPHNSTVALLYLEPDGDRFAIRAGVVTSDEPSAEDGLAMMMRGHRPARHDEDAFKRVARACIEYAGDDWQDLFLKQVDRASFSSLAGYVYKNRHTVESSNLDSCLVFDRAYMHCLPAAERLRNAFNFKSVIAVPSIDDEGKAHGVLMALRRLRWGFVAWDRAAVEKTASAIARLSDARRDSIVADSAVS